MKTVIVLSLLALAACTDKKDEPVDRTQTTSAIVVEPTLHDGHAAEPTPSQTNENEEQDLDVDENTSGPADETRDY